MFNINDDARITVLLKVYEEWHDHIKASEENETKIVLTVCGLYVLFSGAMARKLILPSAGESQLLLVFVIAVLFITIAYLIANYLRIRDACQVVVGFERLLGLYEVDFYKTGFSSVNSSAFAQTAIPVGYQDWGKNLNGRAFIIWSITAVFLCASAAGYAILDERSPPPPPPGGMVPFNFPDHLDLTLHQPDIAATAQKAAQDQQLIGRISKLEDDLRKLTEKPPPPPVPSGSFVIHFTEGVDVKLDDFQTLQDAIIRAKTATAVSCNGYSDKIGENAKGGHARNISTSNDRAAHIRDLLVRAGVPRDIITARGYGIQKPERMVEIIVK